MTDREIDVEIATRIFGIKKIFTPNDYVAGRDALYGGDDPSWIPSGKSPRTHMIDARPVPRYSTDIAAAMEVAEETRGDLQWSINSDGHDWSAELWRGQTTEVAQGRDKSLAKAICLAALSAIRGE